MSLNGGGAIGLGIELSAEDGMSAVFDKANAAVARLHDGLTRMGHAADVAQAAMAGVGKALFDAGKGFIEGAFDLAKKFGGPFEEAMHMTAYLTNATEEQMRDMNEAVFSAQNALLGFTATEAAKALQELGRESGNAQDALDQLEPALLLAGITGRSAESGAKALGATLRSFSLDAKDAGETVDKLAVASRQFHVAAGELQDGLGRVARTAGGANVSFTDAAITVGLLREHSQTTAMAAAGAMQAFQRLSGGGKAVDAAFKQLGVSVKDARGELRPLPDILGDLADKGNLSRKDVEALGKAFGPRSVTAFKGAIEDLSKGITTADGTIVKGSAAVAYLNKQMQDSAGAARAMRDAMLDTFSGQEKVMRAALKSLKTGIAGPLASAFKPVVSTIASGLAKITEFFAQIDPQTKTFIAQAVLLGGVLVTVLGAAFVFLGGPATAAVFALIAAGAALYEAYRSNLGGLADWVDATIGRVSLAFRALSSLFSKGGFSMELFKELQKDPSLLNFVVNVYVAFNRIKAFWDGLVAAFRTGIALAGPTFDRLSAAAQRLAAAFGFLAGPIDTVANGKKFDAASDAGQRFGDILAKVAEKAAVVATVVINVVEGIVSVGSRVADALAPASEGIDALEQGVRDLLEAFGDADTGGQGLGHMLGEVLVFGAKVAGGVLAALGGIMRGVLNIWAGVVKTVIALVHGDWAGAWAGAQQVVYGFVSAVLSDLRGLAAPIDAVFRSIGMGPVVGDALKSADAFMRDHLVATPLTESPYGQTPAGFIGPPPPPGEGPLPAAAAAEAGATSGATELRGLAEDIRASRAQPMTLNANTTLTVDGEVLASVVERHQVSARDRGGVPNAAPG